MAWREVAPAALRQVPAHLTGEASSQWPGQTGTVSAGYLENRIVPLSYSRSR
jgi:hypothetical protein